MDLPEFAEYVQGPKVVRLRYIHHLRLNVTLPTYGCKKSEWTEGRIEIERHNKFLAKDLLRLLKILSTCQAENKRQGLALELCAASPSDNAHQFDIFRCDTEYPFRTKDDLDESYKAYRLHENKELQGHCFHPCIYKTFHRPPNRILGSKPLYFDAESAALYQEHNITIVRSLVTRLQPLRQICPHCIGTLLEGPFRNVRCLRLEALLGMYTREAAHDSLLVENQWPILMSGIVKRLEGPDSYELEHLSLFLSPTKRVLPGRHVSFLLLDLISRPETDFEAPWKKALSELVLQASFRLIEVSAAFLIDACWFFSSEHISERRARMEANRSDEEREGVRNTNTNLWPRLRSIALTTYLLRPRSLCA